MSSQRDIKPQPIYKYPRARIPAWRLAMISHPPAESIEGFESLFGLPGAEFVAHGDAADIRMLKSSTGPSSSVQAVHKVLRIKPMSSDLAVYGTEVRTFKAPSPVSAQWRELQPQKKLWNDFLKNYHAKVNQWQSLEHENVVRVLGLGAGLNLKVETCERGTVREFLKTKPQPCPIKLDIIAYVLEGVRYLHSHNPPIAHGGLNAGKLFIDATGTVKIGEFGLATLCDPFAGYVPDVSLYDLVRWLSPEYLRPGVDPTLASDIWALGCVFLEIIAETIPYSGYEDDLQIRQCILDGELPGQRDECFEDHPFDHFWPLLADCWRSDPESRPLVSGVFEQAREVFQVLGHQIQRQLPAASGCSSTAGSSTTLANVENSKIAVPLPVPLANVPTNSNLPSHQETYSSNQVPAQSSSPDPSPVGSKLVPAGFPSFNRPTAAPGDSTPVVLLSSSQSHNYPTS